MDNFDLGFKPRPNKVAWQLVMVANLIDLARGFRDVSKLDGLIMTIDLVAEELSLLDEKTMFDTVEIQGMQVNWEIMQLSEEIDSLIQVQYL